MAGWHRGRRSLPGPRGSARSQGRGGCGGSRPGRAHRRRAPGPAGHPCPAYRRRAGTRGAPRTPGSWRQAPARGARPGSRPPPAPGPAASLPSPPLPCLPCRRGAARRGARRGDVAVAVCQRPAAGRLPPVQGNGRGAVRGGSGVRPPLLGLVLPVWRGGAPEGSGLTGAVGSAPGRLSARPCSACGPGRPIPSHSVPSHPIPAPLEGPPGSHLCPLGQRPAAGRVPCAWPGSCSRSSEREDGNGVFTKWHVSVGTKLTGF